jgi:acyl carrier protein
MDVKEFIENVAAQFDSEDANSFALDTQFKELSDWSSLIALSIISMIDEEYDITIKGDELVKVNTIKELIELDESKQ